MIQSHKLIVDRSVVEQDLLVQADREQYSFVQQMTRMARLKGCLAHEDRLEAVGMACGYWTDRMSRDQDKAVDQHNEDLMDAEIEKFMESVLGIGAGRPQTNWNDDRRRR